MQGFTYYAPTEVVFGKETEEQTGRLIKKYGGHKALIVYGGGSVVKSGLLDRVKKSLSKEDVQYVEWGGVKPNPRLSHAAEGVSFAVKEQVDFILSQVIPVQERLQFLMRLHMAQPVTS